MYFLLHYDYVAEIETKRTPYREQHLSILNTFQERDQLILAGADGDPITGATFVFKVDSPSEVEGFVNQDPYVKHGLVTNKKIKPWNVVIGSAHSPE